MRDDAEIIAVVLPDGTPDSADALNDFVATGTMLLLRHADGQVSLEPARREAAWSGKGSTGMRPRKRQPILDPMTREVVGFEFEMSAAPQLA